jgi:hypothetical protein
VSRLLAIPPLTRAPSRVFWSSLASVLAWLLLVTVVGCDGPVTVEQRPVGAWRGRAESAAERVEREWPTAEANADSSAEELQAALAKITPTMLEKHQGFQIELDFGAGATLAHARRRPPIEGRWRLLTVTRSSQARTDASDDQNTRRALS